MERKRTQQEKKTAGLMEPPPTGGYDSQGKISSVPEPLFNGKSSTAKGLTWFGKFFPWRARKKNARENALKRGG